MKLYEIIPWRIRNQFSIFLEEHVRPNAPKLYKLIKFGRTNLNTPDYWNEEWKNDTVQRDYVEMFGMILEQIPEGVDVLDVGCGVGRLSKLIKQQRNAELTCLDFSSWACEQLAKEGFRTVVSQLPKIPLPDNSFDIAVSTEVFEHLDHPEKTVQQMGRVVRAGGLVICSTPNDTLHPHEELEHQQSYTIDTVRQLLLKLGSQVTIKTGVLFPDSKHEFILGIVKVEK